MTAPTTPETAPDEALWTLRYCITGKTQTVTTTELGAILRDPTTNVFDVTPLPQTTTPAGTPATAA